MGGEIKVRRLTKRILDSAPEVQLGVGSKVYVGPPGECYGALSYLMSKDKCEITSVFVKEEFRRLGYGRSLIEWLVRKSRVSIRYQVSEYFDDIHLLLRCCGFKCVSVARGGEDGDDYIFHFSVE